MHLASMTEDTIAVSCHWATISDLTDESTPNAGMVRCELSGGRLVVQGVDESPSGIYTL